MGGDAIQIGSLEIDTVHHIVTVDGRRVPLVPQEYQILTLLAESAGCVVTRRDMMDRLYGGMDEPEPKMIDIFVSHMRKVLAAASRGQHFVSVVWGKGYTLSIRPDGG